MSFLIAATGAYTLSRFAEQGLSDLCGLKTFRHGTDPFSWIRMHFIGASPSQDISGFDKDKRFTLLTSANDYTVSLPDIKLENLSFLPKLIEHYAIHLLESHYTQLAWSAVKRIMPILKQGPIFYLFKKAIMYSLALIQKGSSTFNKLSVYDKSSLKKTWFATTVLAILTPTLKIRKCETEDLDKPALINFVVYSRTEIPFHDIGIIGVFKNGLKNLYGVPPLFKKPTLVLKGFAKLILTASTVLAVYTIAPNFVAAHKTAIIGGAILGAL